MKAADPNPDLENLLLAAQDALNEADLSGARARFRSVLDLDPKHALANYWSGVLALKADSPQEAVAHLEIAASQQPEVPDFHVDLGLACLAAGRLEQAETCFARVRETSPDYGAEQLRLAERFDRQKKLNEALEACRRGLLLFPDAPGLVRKLSDLCLRQNRWPEALQAWQRLLQSRPNCVATSLAFGEACYQAGDFDLARATFQRVLEIEPGSLSALFNLGLTNQKLGQRRQALECFQRSRELNPGQAEIHKVLGDLYRELGQWPEANAAWRKAVELRPAYADAWQNLGLGLECQYRIEEALTCHERVVQLRPNDATAHRYLGMARQDLGQLAAARESYLTALRLAPKDAEAHWQLFSLMAAGGEFPQAWQEHEWRWQLKWRTTPKREFAKPAWDGTDLAGRTILVYSEQGFGDVIQAVRYVPLLRARGARVLLWCPPELVSLFQSVSAAAEIFSQLTKSAAFDVHAPLMSLPLLFATTLTTIPREVPYLRAPKNPLFALPLAGPGLKVGLVWCGSLSQPNDRRPVPFECLSPLLGIGNVQFYSLQTGAAAADWKRAATSRRILDLSPHLADFAATASAIQQLDLVVTVDTSVAHLAGALGKPVWVLLSFAPDWRWMREREDSPWYPSMRLFRQVRAGDWAGVIERVCHALSNWAGSDAPSSGVKNWFGLGLAHHQAGRFAEADALYRRVLGAEPRHADALRFLGVLERQRGNLEAARAWLEQAREVQPDSAFAHHDLGLVWFELGEAAKAIAAYERALQIQPQFPDAHYNLGNACYAAKKSNQAEACYRRALEQQPDLADAHFNLGLLAQEAGRHNEAIASYQQALQIQPQHAGALLNLALALKDAEQLAEAETHLRKLLELEPANAEARVNLSAILGEQARNLASQNELKRAEALCAEALEEQPALAQAWVNLGVIRQALGQVADAADCFRRALALQPENADARYNLGIAELLTAQFGPGWKNYEARWQTANPVFAARGFAQPRWRGEDLSHRTLLIHTEQGLGDAVQFVRYAPLVAPLGGRIILECPSSLQRLLGTVDGVSTVIARGAPAPPCDFQIPLMSLPLQLGTTLQTIPNAVPYLKVPEGIRCALPAARPARLRVGIVWAGNPKPARSRSLPLAALSPLATRGAEEIALYSLQVGTAREELAGTSLGAKIVDLAPQLTDFAATAAAIQQLDLVITVDTAVAHLAGALAKPVWVLLPFAPDWRWLLGREDSPWYPTMRLFRQQTHGDWAGVIARVVTALERSG